MIIQLNRGNANLGGLRTRGADLSLSYRFPRTSYGQFSVRNEATWVREWASKSTNEGTYTNYAGEYGLPKWRSNLTIDWNYGNWNVTLGTRFYMDQKTQCWDTDVECSNPGEPASWGTDVDHKGNKFYSDLSVSYAFPWHGKLMVGANNVFNKKPEIVYDAASGLGGDSSSSAVDPNLPIDRFIYVRYNQSF
jgi:iron complex outermembrane receptor protein